MTDGDWRKPKSDSFESFAMWCVRFLILVAFLVIAFRYAITADASTAPWSDVPILSWFS